MAHFNVFLMSALAAFCSAKSAKVLLIAPPTYSHCAEVSSVGQELVDRGHNVTILFSVTYDHNNCHLKHANGTKKINTIFLTPAPDVVPIQNFTKWLSKVMTGEDSMRFDQRLRVMAQLPHCICGNTLSDKKTILGLKEEGFDLVIYGGAFMNYCLVVVPYILKLPFVTVSTIFEDFVSGRPFLPSITPDILTAGTGSVTFFQRLKKALGPLALHALVYYSLPMEYIWLLAPELSRADVINLNSQSDLFLYNYDTILAYPLPQMPNHVYIGGIGVKPPSPLTGEIHKYYQQSRDGVVLVTFGGNAMEIEQSKVDGLLRVFQKIKFNVLWKYGEGGEFGNVKQMKWVPQNDLLGHPNTVLFVSHCGNNGVFEALYNAVPLVCTPIIGDQVFNGARIQDWGVGVSVPLIESSEEEIYAAIMEVLNNPKYRNNMKRASEMYHSQPQTPRQRAGDAIESLLRFGVSHLRSQASQMSVFTYMGYDLVCFVLAVLLLIDFLIYKCVMFAYRRCRKHSNKEKIN